MILRYKRMITMITILLSMLAYSTGASANSGGGSASASASAGGAPTTHLEPFVVNLSSFDRYLQAVITLQVSATEVADKIKTYMPVVRHVVILTLSNKESADVQSSSGKKALVEELREKLNKALNAKEHEGVSDVFFENFVIQ